MRANDTYSESKRQFSGRNRDVLMNVQSPHKWWSTLKSAVFGSSSALPPLVSDGGGLVCESTGKADLLSIILTTSSPGRLLICRALTIHLLVLPPLPSGREVRRLLLDLDPYGGTGMFPLFLVRTADVMGLWPPVLV